MEIENCSSRTNKSGLSKTEAKPKKSKKIKKKRSSAKSDVELPGDVRLTISGEKSAQKDEETSALEVNCATPKDSSIPLEEALKSLILVNGEQTTSRHTKDLHLDSPDPALGSKSNFQQSSSNEPGSNQVMANSTVQGSNSDSTRSKQHFKNNSRSRHSNNKQIGNKHSRNNHADKCCPKPTHPSNSAQMSGDFFSISSPQHSNSGQISSKSATQRNESLRWENVLEDSEEERERIAIYKINRRKRYMAAAQAKGLSWAVHCPSVSSSFQLPEDVSLTNFRVGVNSYTDYRPMRNLGMPLVPSLMGAAMIEC